MWASYRWELDSNNLNFNQNSVGAMSSGGHPSIPSFSPSLNGGAALGGSTAGSAFGVAKAPVSIVNSSPATGDQQVDAVI